MAGKAGEPHIPLALQRSRLKAEEKTLDFEFEVVSVQFNRRGCYALRLTVENPLLQGSGAGIQLRVNGGSAARSSTSTTDIVEQSHLNRIYSFQRRKFTFTLPRGFCKNDKNHDVRLHIEALRFPGRAERPRRGRRVGEAFFAIYPRPDQPRLKLSARRNEDWYRYSAVVALLRVGSEQPAMHCGRLAFTVSLHEHRAPPAPAAPPPRPPSSQGDEQAAGTAPASPDVEISPRSVRTPESAYHSLPAEGHAHFPERLRADPELSSSPELLGGSGEHPSSSSSSSSSYSSGPAVLSCSSFHLSSPGYSPDPASSPVQVSKSPAVTEGPGHTSVSGGGHVAPMGKETITITLHRASNLPATREGQVPWPYVVVKTSGGAEQKPEASRASSAPTHAPTWEEEVMVEMDAEDAGWAVLTLTVADKPTKEALGTFQLPVRHLQPFQPHHCRLVLPRRQDSVGMVLHVTITRKKSFIPRCDGLGYVALEVLLRGLSAPLTTLPRTLVAVARVVTNVQEYKHRMEKHPIPHPSISPTTILFPDPPAAAFSITRAANHGCPQISRPAGPQEQPSWNASFLFQGQDAATIFSEDTALTIEFYPYKAVWDAPGTLIPVGYSVLPLTSRVFQELAACSGGMHVEGLAVERPAAFLTPSGGDALPSLDPATLSTLESSEEPQVTPLYPLHGQLHQDDTSLPAVDAMASILPGKQPLPHGEQRSQEIFGDRQELISGWREMHGDEKNEYMNSWMDRWMGKRRMDGRMDGEEKRRTDTWMDGWMDGQMGKRRMDGRGREGWMVSRGEEYLDVPLLLHGGSDPQVTYPELIPWIWGHPWLPWGASSSVLGWQEVGSYRLALKRMAGDLLSLRRHVTSLEVENGHLRSSLASQQEWHGVRLAATLKHKLVASTAEMRRLKDRVQQLQNELIRKNDREKELVLLQRAHRLQQAMLRRCQDKAAKAKGLEETVQQQEKVIEVMERVLQEKLARAGRSTEKPAGEALSGEVHTALLAENRRLREELARAAHPAAPIAPRPPTLPGVLGGTEKLSLLARLEEAQARGRVLERQLEKAARKWGREKQELGTRLLEQENGFLHPSQNLTAISTAPRRRPHILPPLP
ncbi:coiled-coil domain-containing protein 33 [Myiozetetes cayanensis]|uniref:coiled-coil domain-containing protein 33 n=1 Tax=Myiozetetes cayanensis TaxID=478635 RepID=UPI00215F4E43|nr:coiled-coil domain-containing protein 33 [Myiozetetes cayanensis]